MSATLMAREHSATTRTDTSEVVRELNANLGTTAVAALAGSRDSKLPYKWVKGTRPSDAAIKRLNCAHMVWNFVAKNESDHIARSWFIGVNPLLDSESPLLALRDGKMQDVVEAAEAFVTDVWQA